MNLSKVAKRLFLSVVPVMVLALTLFLNVLPTYADSVSGTISYQKTTLYTGTGSVDVSSSGNWLKIEYLTGTTKRVYAEENPNYFSRTGYYTVNGTKYTVTQGMKAHPHNKYEYKLDSNGDFHLYCSYCHTDQKTVIKTDTKYYNDFFWARQQKLEFGRGLNNTISFSENWITISYPTGSNYILTLSENQTGKERSSYIYEFKGQTLVAVHRIRQKPTIKVELNCNGGNLGSAGPSQGLATAPKREFTLGQKYKLLPTPAAPTGYTFDGWYTAKTGGNKIDSNQVVSTSHTTLYARWKVDVSFNVNGGSGSISSKTYYKDSKYGSLPNAPTAPEGYTFAGWYTSQTGGKKIETSTAVGTYKTLYARWKIDVSFNVNGGSGSVSSGTYYKDTKYGSLPNAPTAPEGYTFAGWYTSQTGGKKIETSTAVGTYKTLYARWKVDVSFNVNGGSGSVSFGTYYKGFKYGSLPDAPTAPKGFAFAGWYTSQTGGKKIETSTAVGTYKTLYARWKIDVSFNVNGGSGSVSSKTYYKDSKYGSLPDAPTAPKGYSFAGWYTDSKNGNKIETSTAVGNYKTLYAHWNENISITSTATSYTFKSSGEKKSNIITYSSGKSKPEITKPTWIEYDESNGSITLEALPNAGGKREDTVKITIGSVTKTITVKQGVQYLGVDYETPRSCAPTAGTAKFWIKTNGTDTEWQYHFVLEEREERYDNPRPSWVHESKCRDDGLVTIDYDANTTSQERSFVLYVYSGERRNPKEGIRRQWIVFTQKPNSVEVKDEAGQSLINGSIINTTTARAGSFLLDVDMACGTYTVSSNAGSWLTVQKLNGNSKKVLVQWTDNRSGGKRTGEITISSGRTEESVTFSLRVVQDTYLINVSFPEDKKRNIVVEGVSGEELSIPAQVIRDIDTNGNQMIIGWSANKGASVPDNGDAFKYTLPSDGATSMSLYMVLGKQVWGTVPDGARRLITDCMSKPYNNSTYNLNYNSGISLPDDYLCGQGVGELSQLKYGDVGVTNAGCGPVAIYNALRAAGVDVEFKDIIAECEQEGHLMDLSNTKVIVPLIDKLANIYPDLERFKEFFNDPEKQKAGGCGTNPYYIKDILEGYGLKEEEHIDAKEFLDAVYDSVGKEDKAFILCTWNQDGEGDAHYRTLVTSRDSDKITVYNEGNNTTEGVEMTFEEVYSIVVGNSNRFIYGLEQEE